MLKRVFFLSFKTFESCFVNENYGLYFQTSYGQVFLARVTCTKHIKEENLLGDTRILAEPVLSGATLNATSTCLVSVNKGRFGPMQLQN